MMFKIPINIFLLETLEKKGALIDTELYEILKENYEDLSFNELNQNLMRLEILGRVRVSSLAGRKRRVMLLKQKK